MTNRKIDSYSLGPSTEELLEEMGGVELGDKRRNERLFEIIRQLASSPSSSFSKASETEAQLEGMYRFFRNSHVMWENILEPHIEKTFERARHAKRVLAIHDTSTFRVSNDAELESYIQTGKRGFFAHASMLVDMERRPLGIASIEVLTREKKQNRTKKNGRCLGGNMTRLIKDREFLRWGRAVNRIGTRMEGVDVIHVMDRETDSYELLNMLHQTGQSFVIRWCKNRRARLPQEQKEQWSKCRELFEQASALTVGREVCISKRKTKTAPDAKKANPARRKRKAQLQLSSCEIEFQKPHYLPESEGFDPTLRVNLVRAVEPKPPETENPIEWVLLTNLPVNKAADVEEVVDIYRARWLIEEFFKALKTGCGYRTRRLTNVQSIFNSFATLTPIAVKALALRRAADSQNEIDPKSLGRVLELEELAVLKAKARKMGRPLSNKPKIDEVLALVARLGGHRKSSGPPGWITLMRGLEKLQNLAEGWALAQGKKM